MICCPAGCPAGARPSWRRRGAVAPPNQYLVHVVVGGDLRDPAGRWPLEAAGQVPLGHAITGSSHVSAVLGAHGLTPWLGMPIAAPATGAPATSSASRRRGSMYYSAWPRPASARYCTASQPHRITGVRGKFFLGSTRSVNFTEHYVLVWACVGLWRAISSTRASAAAPARGEAAAEDGVDTAAGAASSCCRGIRRQPLRALHHGDQPGDLRSCSRSSPPDGGDRHRALLGAVVGAVLRPLPETLRRWRLGSAALRLALIDPVPAAASPGCSREGLARPLVHVRAPAVRTGVRPRAQSHPTASAHTGPLLRSAGSPSSSAACAYDVLQCR